MTILHELAWSSELETGVDFVDSEHKRLVEIINMLGKLCVRNAPVEEMSAALGLLRDYTVYHFKNEEDLMDAPPLLR